MCFGILENMSAVYVPYFENDVFLSCSNSQYNYMAEGDGGIL
jgi:hypothetical protein